MTKMNIKDITDILENNAHFVNQNEEHFINTNNGILNEDNITKAKQSLLANAIKYLSEEIVDSVQQYPEDDISQVDLSTDIVILKRTDFLKLKRYIDNG